MFEAFFTDSCLRYRIEVINGIDFYGLGFGMVRGESMGKWISQWMQKGETASVLITNTKLPDTSGFEFAERIRSQCPRVRVIFVTDTPSLAEAQQAVRCGAYDYLPKSDGIDALRSTMIRVSEELHAESREEAYLRSQVAQCTVKRDGLDDPLEVGQTAPVAAEDALGEFIILERNDDCGSHRYIVEQDITDDCRDTEQQQLTAGFCICPAFVAKARPFLFSFLCHGSHGFLRFCFLHCTGSRFHFQVVITTKRRGFATISPVHYL